MPGQLCPTTMDYGMMIWILHLAIMWFNNISINWPAPVEMLWLTLTLSSQYYSTFTSHMQGHGSHLIVLWRGCHGNCFIHSWGTPKTDCYWNDLPRCPWRHRSCNHKDLWEIREKIHQRACVRACVCFPKSEGWQYWHGRNAGGGVAGNRLAHFLSVWWHTHTHLDSFFEFRQEEAIQL